MGRDEGAYRKGKRQGDTRRGNNIFWRSGGKEEMEEEV